VNLSITVSYLFRNGLVSITNEKGQLNNGQQLGEGAAGLGWNIELAGAAPSR